VPVTEALKKAVHQLSLVSGYEFLISDAPVVGTEMHVVYTLDHPFRQEYSVAHGIFGFRVPAGFPNACPEDSFFIQPATVKLKVADAIRNSVDVHRAGPVGNEYLNGTPIGGNPALVFSWHIWNKGIWDRNKHTLVDHYTHCVRRFDQPEHDG
jgi:hypothetical protein